MDKPNRNKTITIKINGNEEAYINERNKEKEAKQKELEQEGAKPLSIESAASKETSDESFDWVIPSEEVKSFEKESVFVSGKLKKKKNNRNERMFQKLFVSIITAVLIGAGFWYIVFRTITASEAPAVDTTAPLNDDAQTGQSATVSLEPIDLFFVQGGVFSNREAAEAARDDFTSKDFPAIAVSDGDKTYVALFVSDSFENAKKVGAIYKEKGMDVYWKEITIAGGESGLSADDAKVVAASAAFYQTLAGAVTKLQLGSEQAGAEALKSDLNDLLALEVKDENVSKMVVSLKEAAETVTGADASEDAIVQIQMYLLEYISMYEQLIES
ncbi:MAG: SPOR domain-containing protein [Bacillus sp. (in: firmicutes)]